MLRRWDGVEPSGSFDADVLRRVRLAGRPQPGWLVWVEATGLRECAVAAMVAILLGSAVGLSVFDGAISGDRPGVLRGGSLAGSYVQLAMGE